VTLALPPIGRRVLGFGMRALRQLGLRPTEINSLLSLSAGSVKRYTVLRKAVASASTARRRLRKEQEEALVLYWCAVVARWRPLAPVAPGRRLLDAFCPVCLHAPIPEACSPAPDAHHALVTLEDALAVGTACCAAGVRPCVQGPARFAGLVSQLNVDPGAAADYLSRLERSTDGRVEARVHPGRLWVRTCLSCGEPIVTDGASDQTRLCRRHMNRSA
jgi:hypothetical protein